MSFEENKVKYTGVIFLSTEILCCSYAAGWFSPQVHFNCLWH